jgi:hypothetical protein
MISASFEAWTDRRFSVDSSFSSLNKVSSINRNGPTLIISKHFSFVLVLLHNFTYWPFRYWQLAAKRIAAAISDSFPGR